MAQWLKRGVDDRERRVIDAGVRKTVEDAIEDVEKRGDAAIRDMSVRFDKWDREDYRLTESEIAACLDQLSKDELDDIRFAQLVAHARRRLDRDQLGMVRRAMHDSWREFQAIGT